MSTLESTLTTSSVVRFLLSLFRFVLFSFFCHAFHNHGLEPNPVFYSRIKPYLGLLCEFFALKKWIGTEPVFSIRVGTA